MDELMILRFGAIDPNSRQPEYIVIVDDPDEDPEGHVIPGYRFKEKHQADIDNGMMLPLGYVLMRTF